MIAITGANGQLGQLVVRGLLDAIPEAQIVAVVRNPEQADSLRALGVQVREGDYDRPATLEQAFAGVDKVLLISAVQRGERVRQHKAVIDSARRTGVKSIVYTSLLRADTSRLILAGEHLETEIYLKQSGLEYTILRNGWYLENHTGSLTAAIAHGAVIGSARNGRFASASRADYAGAAVKVLTEAGHEGKIYELHGDESFSMADYTVEISKQIGKHIPYTYLPPDDYTGVLLGFGLPEPIAEVVVDADVKSTQGELDGAGATLSTLLGRKTTSLSEAIAAALPS
jgi:NAD(P)H dehydrogenase (quinone)